MEFSDLQQQFKGFTAEQVCNLATYGKDILDIAGIHLLPSNLISLVKAVLISDDIDTASYKGELTILLQIAEVTEKLTDECWCRHKTPLGLTGVDFDNCRFKLDQANELSDIALNEVDKVNPSNPAQK